MSKNINDFLAYIKHLFGIRSTVKDENGEKIEFEKPAGPREPVKMCTIDTANPEADHNLDIKNELLWLGFVTTAEAAKMLDRDVVTVRKMIHNHALYAVKDKNKWWVSKDSIDSFKRCEYVAKKIEAMMQEKQQEAENV